MLLDALMAASDQLVVTYAGNDDRSNEPARPPCRWPSCSTRSSGPGRGRAGRRPPPAAAVRPAQLQARRAGRRHAVELDPRHPRRRASDGGGARRAAAVPGRPLPPRTGPVLELEDLVAFVSPPGQGVPAPAARRQPRELGRRGGRRAGGRARRPRDVAGRRAAAPGAARGRERRRRVAAERARGKLPPGVLADPVIAKLLPEVEQIAAAVAEKLPESGHAESVEVRATLGDGRTLSGSVPGVVGDTDQGPSSTRRSRPSIGSRPGCGCSR